MTETSTDIHNRISQRVVKEDFSEVLRAPDADPMGAGVMVLAETILVGALLAFDSMNDNRLDLAVLATKLADMAAKRANRIKRDRAN